MTGIVAWASHNTRMILTLIVMSLTVGVYAYFNLPKEGQPDIQVPFLFVSIPYPGISAEDSEKLLVRPMETALADVKDLKRLSANASENYAGIILEFPLDWNRDAVLADVRDKVATAQSLLPADVGQYTINEINFSEFPVLVVSLSGNVPERTMLRVAKDLQSNVEAVPGVLQAGISGQRNEMLEVLIDPLKMEAYNVTAGELMAVVNNNNKLIAAGAVNVGAGSYSIKIPSSFNSPSDVYNLPVKRNGDSVIKLGQLADIRLTFEDAQGTARYNGNTTVALQIVKRKGANLIDTVEQVRQVVADSVATWPTDMQQAVQVNVSMDNSVNVKDMVSQLEASVLTAIALVMIVILASLGIQSALLVGFAIPTSFLLTFALLQLMGISVSNIVMFGLILAVGMLVDGAIVVVEFADQEINRGVGPMRAYRHAATRMFWPIVSSTATTLSAFLPMLFWPGIPGQFMRNLPVTLIFVLSASLVVALIFLPVVGGVAGRISHRFNIWSEYLRKNMNLVLRLGLVSAAFALAVGGVFLSRSAGLMAGATVLAIAMMALSVSIHALKKHSLEPVGQTAYKRSWFGHFINFISGNPIMPVVSIVLTSLLIGGIFMTYQKNNLGVEFFVNTEPERAIAYVRARGNLSLSEQDRMVGQVENAIKEIPGVDSIFAFAGSGGLNQNTGGASAPQDAIGQVQIELLSWQERKKWGPEGNGNYILDQIRARLALLPGIQTEIVQQAMGPASSKPVHIRLKGTDWQELIAATNTVRAKYDTMDGLVGVDDTLPLPGIDWKLNVDVEQAGRYGTDVTNIGGMVQLVTRGLQLGTMRTDSSNDEVAIRVRFPEKDRVLSTLDTLRVRTQQGLVPISNFVTREPVPKLATIRRIEGARYFDVMAGVAQGANSNDKIAEITNWLQSDNPLPKSISWEFVGDAADQASSMAFLAGAGVAAMALMFLILLMQFNSFYNSVLVLVAVVLSTAGVLLGMMIMHQAFSVIMTGVGIVALAGIVVNNNIVLIDTYQEFSKIMPKLEAITRTAEARIRPVLLTTITTMAGLMPMMYGLSLDFINGGYAIDTPTSLWWKQLATAVVFGLGFATFLTLIITPALLSLRIWASRGAYAALTTVFLSKNHPIRRDRALAKKARRMKAEEIDWTAKPKPVVAEVPEDDVEAPSGPDMPVRAAE